MDENTFTLELSELHLPQPPVESVRVAKIIDHIGDPAFRVWVVLKEPIEDEERTWRKVSPIEEQLRPTLWARYGAERFPYFTFLTNPNVRILAITLAN